MSVGYIGDRLVQASFRGRKWRCSVALRCGWEGIIKATDNFKMLVSNEHGMWHLKTGSHERYACLEREIGPSATGRPVSGMGLGGLSFYGYVTTAPRVVPLGNGLAVYVGPVTGLSDDICADQQG